MGEKLEVIDGADMLEVGYEGDGGGWSRISVTDGEAEYSPRDLGSNGARIATSWRCVRLVVL